MASILRTGAVMAASIPAGIAHCLDSADDLQELFMGTDLQAQQVQQQAQAAAAPTCVAQPPVDVRRIQVDRSGTDGLREALMSS